MEIQFIVGNQNITVVHKLNIPKEYAHEFGVLGPIYALAYRFISILSHCLTLTTKYMGNFILPFHLRNGQYVGLTILTIHNMTRTVITVTFLHARP